MGNHEPDIHVLLSLACAGDEPALERLLILVAPALRTHIEHEIQPRWRPFLTADDILQETFIDVCASIGRFTPDGDNALMRWLKRIAQNNIADAIRAITHLHPGEETRRPRYLTGLGPHLTLLQSLAGTNASMNVGRNVFAAEAQAMLRQALAALPEHHRIVVDRFDLQGHSMSDIAADLGKSIGAAYLIRNRALGALRGLLGGHSTYFRNPA